LKVVILAGGLGTRLTEETTVKPKPMVEIGGYPLLWHIMKSYAHYGFKEFVIALGYKGEIISRYFLDYYTLSSDISINLGTGETQFHDRQREDWLVHLIDTGAKTMTGGRVGRLAKWLQDETFMLTYGDGVCNIDINALLAFHRAHGKIATVTAVRPPARFGGLLFEGDRVSEFTEKPQIGEGWINGGFMVFEPQVLRYMTDDQTILEAGVLEQLASEGQLVAYRHGDFWQCMDTLREVQLLQDAWERGAPWKVWG
jgi:glucose-1-phosphate cytidylyltransferase